MTKLTAPETQEIATKLEATNTLLIEIRARSDLQTPNVKPHLVDIKEEIQAMAAEVIAQKTPENSKRYLAFLAFLANNIETLTKNLEYNLPGHRVNACDNEWSGIGTQNNGVMADRLKDGNMHINANGNKGSGGCQNNGVVVGERASSSFSSPPPRKIALPLR